MFPARAWTQTAWYLEMSTITTRPHTSHSSPLAFYNFFFPGLKFCADFKVALPKQVLPVIANHLKSLRLLDSKLKGRKWWNVYSRETFSNTPTVKEVSLTEIDSYSWLNVHNMREYWSMLPISVDNGEWMKERMKKGRKKKYEVIIQIFNFSP